VIDPENRFVAKAAEAMERIFGRQTAFIGCGGSIPIVGLFQKSLKIPSVLAGFGLPDDRIHGPNEKLFISNYLRGIECMKEYYRLLAG
jgi:acetylornithine deacetylase/succinyl-diaminopimelate desuccinylase-like protein